MLTDLLFGVFFALEFPEFGGDPEVPFPLALCTVRFNLEVYFGRPCSATLNLSTTGFSHERSSLNSRSNFGVVEGGDEDTGGDRAGVLADMSLFRTGVGEVGFVPRGLGSPLSFSSGFVVFFVAKKFIN